MKITMTFNLSKLQVEESRNEVIIYDQTSDIAAYKQFFISLKLRGLSDRSIQLYMYNIDKFNRFIAKPFKEISAIDIRTYIAHRTLVDAIANSTLDHERGVIVRFFSWLFEEEYITTNPGKRIEKIKVEKRLLESFTAAEVELMRDACSGIKQKMVLEMLLSTACRVAELVTLRMENYDREGGQVSVIGKGNKERIVFIHARAKIYIDAYLKKFPHNRGPIICGGGGIGSAMSTSGIQKMVKIIAGRAGVTEAYPHKFRRTTATDASNRGMLLQDVRELLGHSSAETTLLYIDSSKSDLKAKHNKYVF